MTTREQDVLAVMIHSGVTPSQVARLLNLVQRRGKLVSVNRCDWCPVGKPRPGEKCATVPRASRDKVERVLRRLVKLGKLEMIQHRKTYYLLPQTFSP